MKKTFMFIFSCFLFFSIKAKSDSLIVVYTDWAPYGYLEKDYAKGFEIEVFSNVMNNIGFNRHIDYVNCPWKRCLNLMKNREADILISALKTKEREEYMFYPKEHISISKTAIFTRKDYELFFDGDFNVLAGKRIGVMNAFSYGKNFDEMNYLIKVPHRNVNRIIESLVSNRVDIAIGNVPVFNFNAKKNNVLDKIKSLEPLIHGKKLYVTFSKKKGSKDLKNKFSNALKKFKKTPKYKNIAYKFNFDIN